MKISEKARNALYIGTLCSVSYLAVYFVRNILSAVTPKMVGIGFTEEYIGTLSSAYFIFYAVGQLINGVIGDKIKAKYMLSCGLLFAGIMNLVFSRVANIPGASLLAYGLSGFCLAMIYGPMTKTVAENTDPILAPRCSVGYTFASFFGSPLAGIAAAFLAWESVFFVGSGALMVMAAVVFGFFCLFEKKGIVKYNQYKKEKEKGSIKVLIEHQIIKFSLISMITGIVRTAVVFWLPTYISQHLGFSEESAALLFTVTTLVISANTFIALFVFEKLDRNLELTMIIMFSVATVSFLLAYFISQPALNLIFMVLAVMGSNGAASMLWSRYCPSLRDTGMVSSATGFLDFLSYIAAAISSFAFANAVSDIGWGNLILVWFGLALCGVIVSLKKKAK